MLVFYKYPMAATGGGGTPTKLLECRVITRSACIRVLQKRTEVIAQKVRAMPQVNSDLTFGVALKPGVPSHQLAPRGGGKWG